ncbi:LysR family transcriptional regulator [Psychromonas sp. B3M02]|uniref:LysR family transcriptional regulator n=1 Tax=Psychromonas sp. B3M02 TaxID=2267226 RepID=UPI000DE987D7|nr:LysR family transcriptional regulator [Psychromonas sp. B3M02]RBW43434.1 LysR family transcriptional regulator [Psychromonas sp. B3M02]
MDIKSLKSFVVVAKHKSFSEAARELHTVQPAISRHISALEAELAVTLFHRTSREVSITEAGKQLLVDANAILAMTEQAKTQVKRAENGEIGTLRIAHLSSACLTFMAKLVRQYKHQYPQVHVVLLEMTATEQIDALQSGQIEIAFSRPLPSTIAADFTDHVIYSDQLVAIVNQDHALANQGQLDLSQLKHDPFIIFNRDEALGLFDETITQCKQAGFSPNIVSQPRHMQTLVTEVAAGLGVAIAPYCIRKLYSEGCHFIKLNKVNTEINVQLQHACNNKSAIVKAFTDITLAFKDEIALSMAN